MAQFKFTGYTKDGKPVHLDTLWCVDGDAAHDLAVEEWPGIVVEFEPVELLEDPGDAFVAEDATSICNLSELMEHKELEDECMVLAQLVDEAEQHTVEFVSDAYLPTPVLDESDVPWCAPQRPMWVQAAMMAAVVLMMVGFGVAVVITLEEDLASTADSVGDFPF